MKNIPMYTTEAEMTAWDARIKARDERITDLDIDIELDLRQIRDEEEREIRAQDFIDDLDAGDVYDA